MKSKKRKYVKRNTIKKVNKKTKSGKFSKKYNKKQIKTKRFRRKRTTRIMGNISPNIRGAGSNNRAAKMISRRMWKGGEDDDDSDDDDDTIDTFSSDNYRHDPEKLRKKFEKIIRNANDLEERKKIWQYALEAAKAAKNQAAANPKNNNSSSGNINEMKREYVTQLSKIVAAGAVMGGWEANNWEKNEMLGEQAFRIMERIIDKTDKKIIANETYYLQKIEKYPRAIKASSDIVQILTNNNMINYAENAGLETLLSGLEHDINEAYKNGLRVAVSQDAIFIAGNNLLFKYIDLQRLNEIVREKIDKFSDIKKFDIKKSIVDAMANLVGYVVMEEVLVAYYMMKSNIEITEEFVKQKERVLLEAKQDLDDLLEAKKDKKDLDDELELANVEDKDKPNDLLQNLQEAVDVAQKEFDAANLEAEAAKNPNQNNSTVSRLSKLFTSEDTKIKKMNAVNRANAAKIAAAIITVYKLKITEINEDNKIKVYSLWGTEDMRLFAQNIVQMEYEAKRAGDENLPNIQNIFKTKLIKFNEKLENAVHEARNLKEINTNDIMLHVVKATKANAEKKIKPMIEELLNYIGNYREKSETDIEDQIKTVENNIIKAIWEHVAIGAARAMIGNGITDATKPVNSSITNYVNENILAQIPDKNKFEKSRIFGGVNIYHKYSLEFFDRARAMIKYVLDKYVENKHENENENKK